MTFAVTVNAMSCQKDHKGNNRALCSADLTDAQHDGECY